MLYYRIEDFIVVIRLLVLDLVTILIRLQRLTLRCYAVDFKYKFLTFLYLQVEAIQKMDDSYFGEGLTLLGERFVRKRRTYSFGFTVFFVKQVQVFCISYLLFIQRYFHLQSTI